MKKNFDENVLALISEIKQFEYSIDYSDHIWNIIFPDRKSSRYIRVVQYQDIFYVSLIDGNLCTLEVKMKKSVQAAPSFGSSRYDDSRHDPARGWDDIISQARKWLATVKKDWVRANKIAHEAYPVNRRFGIVRSSLVRATVPDMYRIDKEIGKAKANKFISLVENGYFREEKNTIRSTMTANEYFEYCKLAYLAGQTKNERVDEKMIGRKMYERYADGRDEGLLDLPGDSMEEFADWIDGKHPKKSGGGHPWEIKRGGNTTHIDLSVSRPNYYKNEGFTVSLRGCSFTRLKETICMFLGIYAAGLPITIDDPEGIRKRLLGEDNIGIVPCFDSLHRANQRFHEHEDVYDVMHYDELGRAKRRLEPFITWEPLPILQPKVARA